MPNVRVNWLDAGGAADGLGKGRDAGCRASVERGHLYVAAEKIGTLYVGTNRLMHQMSKVQVGWIDDLLQRRKLPRKFWLQYAYDTSTGFLSRKRNYDALEQAEKEMDMLERSRELKRRILERRPRKPIRNELLVQLRDWLQRFEDVDDRGKILVLWGPSRSG